MQAGADMLDITGALSALDWWQSAGVDTPIAEEPRNWLAEHRVTAATAPAISVAAAPAALPNTLAGFHQWIAEAPDMADGSRQGRRILPSGDAISGIMVMIDMPEPADGAAGSLLSDDSGRLFDKMLAAIGRDRASVYFASLCFERPIGGQTNPAAIVRMGEIARHHIALAAPKRLLLMGQAVSRAILGTELISARGKLHGVNHDGAKTEAVATFAPRFLIQSPARKADAWRDLRLLIGGIEF
ncbi:uracil-DNA glycosylase family protein [Sphingobium boeckii]|uniref:DNA polymerase n=1 Tax=Sphingobium boeckii TaxID=1082345 RepID=A0A7W9EFI2_9SPHN|nr:uracil-DNA glycosylase family protein [Sphingobium boeckii]MBB5687124.1 DNA polymerase [Sphingobium boeckii]